MKYSLIFQRQFLKIPISSDGIHRQTFHWYNLIHYGHLGKLLDHSFIEYESLELREYFWKYSFIK
jgi:hypothetical protein